MFLINFRYNGQQNKIPVLKSLNQIHYIHTKIIVRQLILRDAHIENTSCSEF